MKILILILLILNIYFLGIIFNIFVELKGQSIKFTLIQFIKILIKVVNFNCMYIVFIKNGEGLRTLIEKSIENTLNQNEYIKESEINFHNPRNFILKVIKEMILYEIMNFYEKEETFYINSTEENMSYDTLKQNEVKSVKGVKTTSFEILC